MLPYHGQAPHPGDILLNKLLERTLSISKLARALGLPTRRVTSIVDGATLNADEAKRLGSYSGRRPAIGSAFSPIMTRRGGGRSERMHSTGLRRSSRRD